MSSEADNRRSSTMKDFNSACCSLPTASESGYDYQGSWMQIAGFNTYVTGPENANTAILMVHDIFGMKSQTIQGADLLSHKHRVFMPDLFHGSPADVAWYPPDNEFKKDKIEAFVHDRANPYTMLPLIGQFLLEAEQSMGHQTSQVWGLIGFCWGGHLAALLAGPQSLFRVAVSCHPGKLSDADASNVTIPFAVLASADEPRHAVTSFVDHLRVPKYLEVFDTQIHGWMSARADLKISQVVTEYTRGYQTALKFLDEYLGVTDENQHS